MDELNNLPQENDVPAAAPEPHEIPLQDNFAQKILDSIPPVAPAAPQYYPQYQPPQENGEHTVSFTPPPPAYVPPQRPQQPPMSAQNTMVYGDTMAFQPQSAEHTMQYQPPAPQQQMPQESDKTVSFAPPPPGYVPPQRLQPPQPEKPKKKIKPGILAAIIGGGVALLALLIAGAFFLIDALTHRTVDLASLYSIKIEGYNGYAEAIVEEGEWDPLEVFGSEERAYLYPTLDVTLDKEEEIANGDVITATFTYDEVYAERVGIRFKNSTISITVEGLEEAEIFDPFEGVMLNTEGVSPVGKVTIIGGDEDLYYYYIDGDQRYFKNGDVVTIAVSYDKEEIHDLGGIVLEDKADYEISGLPEYVTTSQQLKGNINKLLSESTGAKMADRLANNAYSIIYEIDHPDYSYLADVRIEDVQLYKTYVSYRKEPTNRSTFNYVHHLYKMNVILTQDGRSQSFEMYALSTASNVIIETDGTLRPLTDDVEFYLSTCFSADEDYLYDENIGSRSADFEIIEVK